MPNTGDNNDDQVMLLDNSGPEHDQISRRRTTKAQRKEIRKTIGRIGSALTSRVARITTLSDVRVCRLKAELLGTISREHSLDARILGPVRLVRSQTLGGLRKGDWKVERRVGYSTLGPSERSILANKSSGCSFIASETQTQYGILRQAADTGVDGAYGVENKQKRTLRSQDENADPSTASSHSHATLPPDASTTAHAAPVGPPSPYPQASHTNPISSEPGNDQEGTTSSFDSVFDSFDEDPLDHLDASVLATLDGQPSVPTAQSTTPASVPNRYCQDLLIGWEQEGLSDEEYVMVFT
ncbi:hypothetical protein HDU93_003769 [Gonapodya sp. JEL0774]|nr:hypothetical protein HDU93_003769 [Gonapodya sp. JEL0774]